MTLADAVLGVMWIGLTAYALFAGADFGGGVWDLLAGTAAGGRKQRALIEHSLAPVWEANHVWLIFVLVVLWTAFPTAFAAIASTLYLPLTLAAVGMIARGSAFAFRKTVDVPSVRRLLGAAFAFSSLLTPFFLGTVAGGIASGRVPPGIAQGDVLSSWLNPTSLLGGVLTVGTCAYLAAVFLCSDAVHDGKPVLAGKFRVRALISGAVVGVIAVIGVLVVGADAPALASRLTGRGLPLLLGSAIAGLLAMWALLRYRYGLVRIAAAVAVTAVIWGWGIAQYPQVLPPGLTIAAAAAGRSTLVALLISLICGAVLLIPSLVLLYSLFHRAQTAPAAVDAGGTGPATPARTFRTVE